LSEAHYVVEHRQDVKKREQAITAIKEALAQPEQAPMNYYRADAKGNLERTDIYFAQPEQDGECKHCTDGCPACDARKLPEQEPVTWRNAAIRVGEDLCSVGPFRYYDMTAEQWLDWALSVVTVHAPPPQRTWVEIDDEDFSKALELCDFDKIAAFEFFEAKLKEKNT